MIITKASSVRSEQVLRRGNLSRSTLLWATADLSCRPPIISNLKHKIWAQRLSIKGTKPLFIVIKAIIIIIESNFYTKLKKLDVQEGKKDNLFADHLTQVCKVHDRVILSFLQQVQGIVKPTIQRSRENTGHNVHVYGNAKRNARSQSVKAGAIEW